MRVSPWPQDGCSCTVIEPPAHKLATLRRTAAGYDAQVDPSGRWYAMCPQYVEEHFRSCGEAAWLAAVGGDFLPVQKGARRRSGKVEPVRKPYCVLGSLAKALRHSGNVRGAERAEADCEASLLAPDRLVFAAERARLYGCESVKLRAKALEVNAANPVLLQVTRTHTVTIYSGLIFDANEPRPLELTRSNLELCTVAPHNDMLVPVSSARSESPCSPRLLRQLEPLLPCGAKRACIFLTQDTQIPCWQGYEFVPRFDSSFEQEYAALPTPKRPALADVIGNAKRICSEGERVCAACKRQLPLDAFSKMQRKKGRIAKCLECSG